MGMKPLIETEEFVHQHTVSGHLLQALGTLFQTHMQLLQDRKSVV